MSILLDGVVETSDSVVNLITKYARSIKILKLQEFKVFNYYLDKNDNFTHTQPRYLRPEELTSKPDNVTLDLKNVVDYRRAMKGQAFRWYNMTNIDLSRY